MNKNHLEFNYTQTVKAREGWIIYVYNFIPIFWRLRHICVVGWYEPMYIFLKFKAYFSQY